MGNQNFLNEDQTEAVEEYIEEQFPQDSDGQPSQDTQTQVVLSEAVKRIEHAKLYETLLNHELFTPGSARQEIIEAVEAEIKQFILSRLEVLLGMAPSSPAPNSMQTEFSQDEISALHHLAGHLLKRNTIQSSNPQMVPVAAAPQPQLQRASQSQPTIRPAGKAQVQPVGAPRPVSNGNTGSKAAPVRKGVTRKRTQNVGAYDGKEYSQARPTAAEAPGAPQPLKMPPQAMIDSINATQVHKTQQAMQLSNGVGKMLDAAVKLAQIQNRSEE